MDKQNHDLVNTLNSSAKELQERIKFWEVETCFTCPIVGMCLTAPEQKEILKKTYFPVKKTDLYEIHEALVVCGDDNNKISRRVDALLERKFMKVAAPLFELDDKAFMSHFTKAFETGEYLPTIWAAAVNPKLSLSSKKKVFSEIHMSMHWGGDESRKAKQKITRLNGLIGKTKKDLKTGKTHKRILQKENDEMAKELISSKHEQELLKKENKALEDRLQNQTGALEMAILEKKNQELEVSLEVVTDSYGDASAQLHALSKKREQLVVELKLQKEMTAQITQEAIKVIGHVIALNKCACDESCPAFNLCEKRVLIVGGIARMESVYRELIEGSGGVFEYHNGYVKQGVKPLEDRMKRADMVLCPVNCNSHTACAVVKKLGKKHKKNVHMLHNYSLSAVSQVIRDASRFGEKSVIGTFGF